MATIDLGRLGFVNKGTYNNSTTYEKNDLVQFTDGGILSTYLYIDSTAQSGQAPSSSGTAGSRWVYYAKGGAAGTDLGATLNNNEIAFKTNAGALDGLAIGSAGQILKVNSGANGYEFGAESGGGLIKLASTKVSGGAVANITFNSTVLDTSTYKKFKFFIHIYGTASGSSRKLFCKPSKDNGSNYNLSAFSSGIGSYVKFDGSNDGDYRTSMYRTGNNDWMLGAAISGSNTGAKSVHWVGEANLYNNNDTSTYSETCHMVWHGGRFYTSDGSDYHTMYQAGQGFAYSMGAGNPVNNVKFSWDSGNVQNDSRITVFGVKET